MLADSLSKEALWAQTCSAVEQSGQQSIQSTILLVEVLSPPSSTYADKTRPLNISTDPTKEEILLIGADVTVEEETHDIFAWEYNELKGIPVSIGVHQIKIRPGCRPVKQAARRVKPELLDQVKAEVMHLHAVDFIYPVWLTEVQPRQP